MKVKLSRDLIFTENGVSVTDLEDGDLIKSLKLPTLDLTSLTEGDYSVKYEVTDSDNNTTISRKKNNSIIK